MNRRASALLAFTFLVIPAAAHAEDAAPAPAPAPKTEAKAEAQPGVAVQLSADDNRATIERRVATTSVPALPGLETGIIGLGHWEHTCVAPCDGVKLDPKYTYRVSGDGLVPTDSFSVPRDAGQMKVDAKMGSSTGRVLGAASTIGGGLLILGGGLALAASPVLASEDVGSKGFRSAVLVGGVGAVSVGAIAATVGLFLWLSNGSTAHTEKVVASAAGSK
jgi:hypothetical protein